MDEGGGEEEEEAKSDGDGKTRSGEERDQARSCCC